MAHDHDDHDHHHHHDHDHGSELSETQIRVRALESILVEKGYVDPAALDALVETYETKVGPHNGARVVAKAWADPEYRAWLFSDSGAAIESRVTSVASSSSLQPSVPSGRMGTTR